MSKYFVRLRPHHMLCTQGYSGRGYDSSFTANMTAITTFLRDNTVQFVEITFSTDDICQKCPQMIEVGLCKRNDKVKRFDQKVTAYFGLENKMYNYQALVSEINTKMTEAMMDDICGDCQWYPISACKRTILGGRIAGSDNDPN